MGLWSIITPVAVTNMVTNPSLELATTGYSAVLGSVARVTTKQRRGAACLEITPTNNAYDGAYFGTVSLTSGQIYTCSMDAFGVLGVPYGIYFATTAAAVKGTPTYFTGTGDWQRASVSWTADATTTFRLYITKNNNASTAVFYIDGLQCVNLAYDVTYCDGDQAGAIWNGSKHASTSTRSAQSRAGGREINLSTYGVKVAAELGIGMLPAKHQVQSQPLLPGGHFQGRKALPRVIDLQVSILGGATYDTLHSLRKDLIDAIKPDLTAEDEPFILRYTGANAARPVDISAVYDSGLEMTNPEWTVEQFTLRLIAYDDPFFYEDGNAAAQLAVTQNVADADYIIQKVDGVWSAMGTGMSGANGFVLALAFAPDGTLYAGGAFTLAGGVADTVYIAKWNGSAWLPLGTGMDNEVWALAVAPDGTLYAGGYFTHAGGVACNYIAKWDGAVWAPLGAGTDAGIRALTFGPDGYLYAGGEFANAGGGAAANIARWNGAAWSALGAGTNDDVYTITFDPYGSLYAGGKFTTAGGVTVNYVAKWNGTAWSALGAGMAGLGLYVLRLLCGPDGTLYAGGQFDTAGGVDVNYIAKWNGSVWTGMQGGANQYVYALNLDRKGLLYAGGDFDTIGGITPPDKMAVWNGTTWGQLDIDLPGAGFATAFAITPSRLYIGFTDTGAAVTSASTTVNNPGTVIAYPVIHLKNSTAAALAIYWIKNETTDKTLWFNYTVQPGEELILDLRPGERSVVSSYYLSAWRALLRNSDFSEFYLLPGNNQITAYGGAGLTAWMEYRIGHWAADGAAV